MPTPDYRTLVNLAGDWLAVDTQGGYLTWIDTIDQYPDMVSLATMKEFLGIDLSDTSQDAVLAHWISFYSTAVQTECDRVFPATQLNMYWKAPSCPSGVLTACAALTTYHYPIISLDAWYVDDVLQSDVSGLSMDPRHGKIWPTGSGWGFSTMQLTYTAGFSTIPADLLQVVIGSVAQAWQNGGDGGGSAGVGSLKSERLEGIVSLAYYSAPAPGTNGSATAAFAQYGQILDRYRSNHVIL